MNVVSIANYNIHYQYLFPETAQFFDSFQQEVPQNTSVIPVQTSLDEIHTYALRRGEKIHYYPGAEYDALSVPTSSALMKEGTFLFHSVAFMVEGKALLLSGPSGIGKTTQYAQWKRLLRDRVKIISGDMPAVSIREDGEILIDPTPWNGKENLHGFHTAPLAGIVVLEQTPENTIRRLTVQDAILPVYSQMCFDRTSSQSIRHALSLEDRLLCRIPVWKLSSRGDLDSARCCFDALKGTIYDRETI